MRVYLVAPVCNVPIPVPSGPILSSDCSKAIDIIPKDQKNPQRLSQAGGTVQSQYKSCYIFVSSHTQLDITLKKDDLQSMHSKIFGICKKQSGSLVTNGGTVGLNGRVYMYVYFNGNAATAK
ncbi:hypothetical protein PGTUg99_032646 [Puccinia graminis f. sp. tritici]|uniref:Uncharacterized protein n=1 Tax=Puccinia graminis f. sp. tritici TaxID=56615 RepID=A0A5B0MGD1_PUCGR|nr:hypothetical protein PGTUg99_032646 [Puccinia graminis f. sp. tritici]